MAGSIVATVLGHAQTRPDAPALIDELGQYSYAMLERDTLHAAARLHAWGVRAGESIGLALDMEAGNSRLQMSLFYALGYLGAKLLLLYPGVPPRRQAQWLERFGARRIEPREFETLAPAAAGPAPRGDDSSAPFLIQFTTGSTGDPKALLQTHYQVAAHATQIASTLESVPQDRLLPAVRWPELVGARHMQWIHSAGGALVNVGFPQSRQELARAIRRHGVTQVRASPPQLRQLLASAPPADGLLPPLRGLSIAGAALSPQEIAAARAALTPNVYFTYGATEIGAIAVLRPQDPVDAGGVPAPQVEAQVVDDRHNRLAPGRIGQIRLRAPWMPHAYAIGADPERFHDGWIYPGDLASIDAQGRITVHGRIDEQINVGGVKIDPRGIEQALEEYPLVREAAAIGIPDPDTGERQVVLLVANGPIVAEDLLAFLRARIEPKRMPDEIRVVASLARSPDGKLLRGEIRKSVLAGPASGRSAGST